SFDTVVTPLRRANEGDYLGGNVLKNIVNNMDRDGQANEVGLNYNSYQMKALERVADYLLTYAEDGKRNYNLFDFPKYAKMFEPWNGLTLVDVMHPNIGDGGAIGSLGFFGSGEVMVTNFMSVYALNNPKTETLLREIAQIIYRWKDYKLEDIRTSIFDEEPEAVQDVLKDYISGEQPLTRSDLLPGYGFAVLRDGTKYNSASAQSKVNTQRDFWMWFGRTEASHSHKDTLRIGMDAFGFSIAPDQGYSANSGKFPQRLQFDTETIAGNTVVVNGGSQEEFPEGATPYHYDDSGIVKLIDAEALGAYKTIVDDFEHYRRTVVMVKVDENNSYGIDFFRVKGGESHMFSFFSSAEHLNAVDGLGECTPQVDENGEYIGSLAGMGPDGKGAPYTDAATGETKYFVGPGQDPNTADVWYYDTVFPRGFSWLGKVRRYNTPGSNFSVEFDIEDYRKVVENNKGIKLRLTQMNDFVPEEVTFAAGPKIDKPDNAMMPKTFDYLLVTNKKQDGEGTLDSLYTTVYEPYQHTRYLKAIEPISTIEPVQGEENLTEDDVVRAVKVTHEKDRTDYIIYATNNEVTYKLTDGEHEIYFKGFVGMYSVNSSGEVLYRYVNDGTVIGENAPVMEKTAYTGTVKDFDMTFDFGDFDNWIDVNIDCEDPSELAGKVIYIENDGVQNGMYEIVDAWKNEDGSTRIDLGTASLVRAYADEYDIDGGYIYNIDVKQSFRIPLAYVETGAPEFDSVGELTTSAGSTLKVKITAHSPLEKAITYSGTKRPRGASVNEATGEITWKPDSSQVGENHFEITAIDSDGRESAIHFIVTVYGATTGSSGNKNEDNSESSSENAGTTGGGGGGGGGGAAPTDEKDDETNIGETDKNEDGEKSPEASGETDNIRFADLSNYAWAADAINSLVDSGV
ncbi:MAG: heparinase II/III family protein, partial [Oscillospiraceae bacterium]|nr:heparinase II/III family protein [Oscillospiraceae bacterium]